MEKEQCYEKLLETFLDIGKELVEAGAEINRTDDTLRRLGKAFGAESTHSFVIYNSISVTMKFDGKFYSQTRSVSASGTTDFAKLERLNGLSRRCAAEKLSPEQLREAFEQIKGEKRSLLKVFAGGVLASSAFAIFFGGSFADALIAAVFGLIIVLLQEYFSGVCPNKMLFTFLSALVSGLGIIVVSLAAPAFHADKIIIGVIMLLVPGKGITNAARDVLLGDTISGAMKLIESMFLAGALAAGYLIALSLM